MDRLRSLRADRKLSQRELAVKIGSSQKAIDNWEKSVSDPSGSAVVKLADFFGCSTDYLLNREDELGQINVNSDLTSGQQELLFYFDRCEKKEKANILDFAKYLYSREK